MGAVDIGADAPRWRQLLVRAKDAVKSRLGSGIPVTPAADGYLVVPVLGQSNAHGAGLGLRPDAEDGAHPLVHQWACSGRSRGKIVAGVDPLFHETPSKGVGFAVSFARNMAEHTGRAVLLVPAARGDTSFAPKNGHTWDPADTGTRVNHYRRALTQIDAALAAAPGSAVRAILWHQGESDVPKMKADEYAVKLDSVIDGLRERYGTDVPVLVGQMVPEEIETGHPNYPAIDAVHADTPNRRAFVAYVEGPRGSYNAEDEKIHYNAAGARELGVRMWQALLELARREPTITVP
jgi:hypothetical protein